MSITLGNSRVEHEILIEIIDVIFIFRARHYYKIGTSILQNFNS